MVSYYSYFFTPTNHHFLIVDLNKSIAYLVNTDQNWTRIMACLCTLTFMFISIYNPKNLSGCAQVDSGMPELVLFCIYCEN